MRKIIDYLFGCTHAHTTFPQARKDRTGNVIRPVRNYVACLDCGCELDYWLLDQQDVLEPAQARRQAGGLGGRLLGPDTSARYGLQPAPRL